MHKVTTPRLDLWRKSISLFHRFKKTKYGGQFIGPFYSLEMRQYKIGPTMMDTGGNPFSPDIVTSNRDYWIVLELTNNDNSKKSKLEEYQKLKKEYLSNHGLVVPSDDKDVMSVRSHKIDDGPFCQIILNEKLDVVNIDVLTHSQIKKALNQVIGTDLSSLPEIPITLLPESKSNEIRIGIVDQVIQLFDPMSEGKTSLDIVEEALERIKDKITMDDTKSLVDKVKREMESLKNGALKGYLDCNNGKYFVKKEISDSPKARMVALNRLREWAGLSETIPKFGYQSSVLDFV